MASATPTATPVPAALAQTMPAHVPCPPAPAKRSNTGLTLVELAIVCAVACVLAAMAVPGFQAHLQQARRADAVDALTRLQQAQEQYRSAHGLYASTLAPLHGVPQGASREGHYALELLRTGAQSYQARAMARADGPQAGDGECSTLLLTVQEGFSTHGPSPRCWNR